MYWSFSFSIIPSKEIPGLISFRMDCLDLLAVQGTLKSLLQHHSSKASSLRCSAFFTVQLSHPYMTTGKTMALTRWTLVSKVMSLLLNMLSRLSINFNISITTDPDLLPYYVVAKTLQVLFVDFPMALTFWENQFKSPDLMKKYILSITLVVCLSKETITV